MKRFNFYLLQEKEDFLKDLEGLTVSEHIRRAIDEYIQRKKKCTSSRSPSSSILGVEPILSVKKGGVYGRSANT